MSENHTAGEAEGDRLLRLLALDESDLDVISAHLQDASVRHEDLHYLPRERRFVLALHRFDWQRAPGEAPRRRLTALHFEQVRAVRHRYLEKAESGLPLNLLAVYFLEGDKPSGAVILEFSGGAAIRLEVECIEAQMKDLGPMWEVENRPVHLPDDGGDGGSDAGKT